MVSLMQKDPRQLKGQGTGSGENYSIGFQIMKVRGWGSIVYTILLYSWVTSDPCGVNCNNQREACDKYVTI